MSSRSTSLHRRVLVVFGLVLAAWLGGCATPAPQAAADGTAWHDVPLPSKVRTEYRWEWRDGRRELVAQADASASAFR